MHLTKFIPGPEQITKAIIATAIATVVFALIVSKSPRLKSLVKDYETST
jgi:hypothetical protein